MKVGDGEGWNERELHVRMYQCVCQSERQGENLAMWVHE